MVYCKLRKKDADHAEYDIGVRVSDMTGVVVFYKDLREPELNKQAKKYPVQTMHIARLYQKYSEEFKNGEFKEKLSYER